MRSNCKEYIYLNVSLAPVRKSKPRIPIRNPESEDIDHETVNGNKNNSKPNSTDDNNNSIIIKVIGGTDASKILCLFSNNGLLSILTFRQW